MNEDDRQPGKGEARPMLTGLAALLSVLIAIGAVVFVVFLINTNDKTTLDIVSKHFPAVIGLPLAAFASFIIVVLLKQNSGPIEFEGLGFKFRGASGQVVMWVLCFLAMTLAIKVLY